jgi:hypothetical protein
MFMTRLSHHNFELLKSKVQFLSGLETVSPADCKIISCLIYKKTKYNISETTIKRIYGFALSRFHPSQFTLEALCIYCNYNGWDDFCNQQIYSSSVPGSVNANWADLQRNASKITLFTLDAIKSRAGIPYNKSLKRQFVDDTFKSLNDSSYTGAAIASPAGYGKTIALCHWIEEQIELDESRANNDVILFFSSGALLNALYSGRDMNDWLLGLLGYTNDADINALWDDKQRKNNKFYLIIDGFDPHNFKPDHYRLLMDHINELLALHKDKPWLKVILSMRNSTLLNYKHELSFNQNILLNDLDHNAVNVPLLTQPEIKTLCKQLNPNLSKKSYTHLNISFNHPLFFQLYYKKNKENFVIDDIDHSTMYELIYSFYINKITTGNNAIEKQMLVKKIASYINLDHEEQGADKLEVDSYIKKYNSTYQELLLSGFLTELNTTVYSNNYNVIIKFGDQQFAGLAVALSILKQHNNIFSSEVIQCIDVRFAGSPNKIIILKWCLLYAVKTGQQSNLLHLVSYNIAPADKYQVALFLGDALVQAASTQNDETLLRHFESDENDGLFDYFFAPELFNKEYKNTLKNLLKFNISDKKRILVYTSLGILSALSLELDELYIYLVKLKSFSTIDTLYFAINPVDCLDAIYHYLKYGIAKKECLAGLTHLCFAPPKSEHELKDTAGNDMLYILGMYTMFICNNPKKASRLINVIKSVYKSDELGNKNTAYGFFVKVIMSDIYFRLGDVRMVTALYYTLSNLSERNGNAFTPFMETILDCLRIKFLLADNQTVVDAVKDLKADVETSGSKLSLLVTLVGLLKNEKATSNQSDFYVQIYQDYKKLLYQQNVNSGLYNSNYVLINR